MNDTERIEGPLLKVPFESLKRVSRDRKYVIDEIDSVLGTIDPANNPQTGQREAIATLETLVDRLQGLKRKLGESSKAEKEEIQRCRARLEHLNSLGVPRKDHSLEWNRNRMERLLVDHMLRSGYQQSALQLAKEVKIQDLVDVHIFLSAQRVVDALRRHDCSVALAWCEETRGRLKKNKSQFEFKLRVQEYIEFVRKRDLLGAIKYARAQLSPYAAQYMPELQRAMAAVAFQADTTCQPYRDLFEESRWQALVELFYKELYKLHNLTPESLLTIHLQAGLSALKTHVSYGEGCSKEDPLHLQTFQKLAEQLPFSKHVHSKLVCSVTKEVMNEHNPPLVLPSGLVYSEKAVHAECMKSEGKKFTCPLSGHTFELSEIKRAFI